MNQTYDDKQLYDSLTELAVIPQDLLDTAYKASNESGAPLEGLLLEQELIADENLGRLIADIIEFPYTRLRDKAIPNQVLKVIPEEVAQKQHAIAFERTQEALQVGMNNPKDTLFIEFLRQKTGVPVTPYYATKRDIQETLPQYKKSLQQVFEEIQKEAKNQHENEEDNTVEKIVDTFIQYAYIDKASDLHLEPEENFSILRFRVDGVLHDVLGIPNELHKKLVARIKIMSKLRTDEHLSAQDGKIKLKLDNGTLDIRVSIVPIVEGEKVVLRLLSAKTRQFALNELGMSEGDLKKVEEAYNNPHGMLLSTGPTGSGKTTTVYGILKKVNTRDVNIATIEDPVEYDAVGVNQIQVNNKTNLTFANGLRSILRQDPDIIFVGEIRDAETAGIAVNAAMTGHLVLSTLHTNNAATTLPRLIDMDIEPFLVATTVNAIVGQRLVRKICEHCIVSENVEKEEIKAQIGENLTEKYFGNDNQINIYKGKGCQLCHFSGYQGRIGLFEVLTISDDIKHLITSKANSRDIQDKAVEEGMTTMLEDGITKVKHGLTTLEEVLRVTSE